MIDKVDRIETPPQYRVTEAKETKEDRHQQQNPNEELEQQQKKIEDKEWRKFGRRTTIIKPFRVAREQIKQCIYRGVHLHSGIGTLQVDVVWRDGRVTRGALMLIGRLEDFIKLKKYAPGQIVPDALWARGPMVEMGIPQTITESSELTARELTGRQAKGEAVSSKKPISKLSALMQEKSRRVNWGVALLLVSVALLIILAIVLMLL